MQVEMSSVTSMMHTLRQELTLLKTQGTSALPERVSKIIAIKDEEVLGARQSVTSILQRQTESQRTITELQANQRSLERKKQEAESLSKEWEDRFKDLEKCTTTPGTTLLDQERGPQGSMLRHLLRYKCISPCQII